MTPDATDAPAPSPAAPATGDEVALFAALPAAAVLLAPDAPRYTVVAVTDAYAAAAETPRAALVGRGLFEVFGDADASAAASGLVRSAEAGLRASFAEVLRTRAPHAPRVQRFDMPGPDGRARARYWQPRNGPVLAPDGAVRYLVHEVEDVTEVVQQRAVAETAEHRAARLLERMTDAYILLDRDFRVVDANPAAERVLGVRRDAFLGRTHWEAWPASAGSEVERRYRRLVADGEPAHFTHHYVGDDYDVHLEIDAYPTDAGGVAVFWRNVTARVHAEAALRESEARYRALAELSPDATWVHQDGRLVYANPAAAQVIGARRPEELLGRSPFDVAEPAHRAALRERIGRLLATGGASPRMEMRWRRLDGAAVDVESAAAAVTWAGRPAVQVIFRDVTERKRAEAEREGLLAALRVERARITEVFRQAPVAVAVLRGRVAADLVYELVNPRYEEAVTGGRAPVGRRLRDVLPEFTAPHLAVLQGVLDSGRPFTAADYPVPLDRDGDGVLEEHYFNFVYHPLVDAAGAVSGLVGVGTEVTASVRARREAERLHAAAEAARAEVAALAERLRASEARFRDAFEQGPAAVAVLEGPEQVYALVSPTYEAWAGRGRLAGRAFLDALPALRDSAFDRAHRRVYATGEPLTVREERVTMDRDGDGVPEEYVFTVHYAPLRDAGGAVYAVASQVVDVTAAVRARRELEAAREEAEAANRAKGEFLAVMSHELRTPLNAIGGYAELMEMGIRGPVTDAQVADLRRIQASQRHLLGLVNEVLNYARIETGTVRYEVGDVPLAAVVAAVEPLVAPQLAAKGLAFGTAACEPSPVARADGEKVRQVLLNLLSNAVKFTDAPGRVDVACEAAGDRVLVRVRDTGIGIGADELARIFEPFVQVNASLTRTADGTGLGLAISRDLARGMGGDLTVESTPGAGSTFTLALPAA